MRKIVVIGISILSVFILCSLSYQPIIADTPIENIPIIKKSKASDLDVDELQELYTKLLELKSQSNDDCGCEETTLRDFPVICDILWGIYMFSFFVFYIMGIGVAILITVDFLLYMFDCSWFDYPTPDKVIYGIEYKSI